MKYDNRIDVVQRPGAWVNRSYSILKDEENIYFIHTGPGMRVEFLDSYQLEGVATRKYYAMVKKNEEKIDELDSENLLNLSKHSFSTKISDITDFSFARGKEPLLRIKVSGKKYKFKFRLFEEDHLYQFMDSIPAQS